MQYGREPALSEVEGTPAPTYDYAISCHKVPAMDAFQPLGRVPAGKDSRGVPIRRRPWSGFYNLLSRHLPSRL